MKILNLYSGIGGNRKLWGDEHDITAVENRQDVADVYSGFYPNDKVIVGDAHQYLIDHYSEFDFIWSSPPCPTHSRLRTAIKEKVYPDMTLYQEIIFLSKWFYGRWVVENVVPYYEPLIKPTFELERHYFWSNFTVEHKTFERGYKGSLSDQSVPTLEKEYGIYLPGNMIDKRKALRNVLRPDVGLHILESSHGS